MLPIIIFTDLQFNTIISSW